VHPVVARLCAPIEGTDVARLADCLGLDASRFAGAAAAGGSHDAREDALVSGAAFFDDPARFKVLRSPPLQPMAPKSRMLCVATIFCKSFGAALLDGLARFKVPPGADCHLLTVTAAVLLRCASHCSVHRPGEPAPAAGPLCG